MEDNLNLAFEKTILKSLTADYTCLQRLGTGGTAETYLMLASSGSLRGQLLAVKVFRRLSKPEWRANFLEEVKFLQTCNHPAVMRVYDEGVYLDQHPFVVAEFLPSTLGNVVRTKPMMMAKMAYAVQLLSALEYLSRPSISVVHRDIKPANIFIKGGSCVLGDFGLMKRLQADMEQDREILKASIGPRMPRHYRTPDLVEYYRGGPVPTVKSDIYQLGLVFAEMFSGTNPQKPMKSNDYGEPVELNPISSIPGGLGEPIRDLISPMLDPNAMKRPTATELMEPWQGLFLDAAKRSHALDGRIV